MRKTAPRRNAPKSANEQLPPEAEGPVLISLQGEQTIARIEETLAQLIDANGKGRDVVIDCAAVTEADLTLVQVLLAARRDAEAAARRVKLAQPAGGALAKTLAAGGFAHPGSQPVTWIDGFWAGEC